MARIRNQSFLSESYCIPWATASASIGAICQAILTSFCRDMASVSLSMDASGIFTVSAKTPGFPRHGRLGGEKNSKATPPATNAIPLPCAATAGALSRFGNARRRPPQALAGASAASLTGLHFANSAKLQATGLLGRGPTSGVTSRGSSSWPCPNWMR